MPRLSGTSLQKKKLYSFWLTLYTIFKTWWQKNKILPLTWQQSLVYSVGCNQHDSQGFYVAGHQLGSGAHWWVWTGSRAGLHGPHTGQRSTRGAASVWTGLLLVWTLCKIVISFSEIPHVLWLAGGIFPHNQLNFLPNWMHQTKYWQRLQVIWCKTRFMLAIWVSSKQIIFIHNLQWN